jgi:prepilin peptidase CpaA
MAGVPIDVWQEACLAGWALLGAGWDLRRRRLPNVLTLGGAALGALWVVLAGQGFGGAAPALCWAGLTAGLLALLPAYALGKMGAGDVKFFAAMGVLGGLWILGPTLVLASLLAGLQALWLLLGRRGWLPLPPLWLGGGAAGKEIPFGVGLGLAFILSLGAGWSHPWFS